MHVASMLGEKFSILSLVQSGETVFRRLAKLYGLEGKIASIRSIDIPVLEMEKKWRKLERSILQEARVAVKEDGADVIILGCTGMIGLEKKLNQQFPGIPVINPGNVAIKMAEILVDLGLSQSKKSFPFPPSKEILK
jgi:allantoin racemase